MIRHVHKVKKHIQRTHDFVSNPFEFILDWIVKIFAYLLIPIPLAADLLVQFRGLAFAFLFNTAVLLVTLVIILINVFTNPLIPTAQANVNIPIDGSFVSTDTPIQNPLGGQGLSLVIITAGFMDPNYSFFG